MSPWLVLAACLAVALGVAHSYLGERYLLQRLFRRGPLPPLFGSDTFTRGTLRFAWHLTTVAWWGAAALVWVLGRADGGGSASAGLRVLAVMFLVSGAVAAIGSRGRHLAWLVLLAIAVAAWLGAGT